MKGLRAILITSGVGVIAYAIYQYYKGQVSLVQDIKYDVTGIKIVSVSQDALVVDITNRIYNSSNLQVTITEMYFDLFINNTKVGNINEVKDIVILANGSSDVSYRFTIVPKLVLNNLVSLVSTTIAAKDMDIKIQGYVKAKSSFLQATIPFAYNNNLKNILNG